MLLGYLVDVLKPKWTAILTMLAGIAAILDVILGTDNQVAIICGVALFGERDYAEVYSTASICLAVASIVALPAYGFIFDAAHSYFPVLWALVVMLALNIVIVLLAHAGHDKLIARGLWRTAGASTDEKG